MNYSGLFELKSLAQWKQCLGDFSVLRFEVKTILAVCFFF